MPCLLTREYDQYSPSILYQENNDSYQIPEPRYHLDFERYRRTGFLGEFSTIDWDGFDGGMDFVPRWIGYS